MQLRPCSLCREIRREDEFTKHRKTHCRSCVRKKQNKLQEQKRKYVLDYLRTHPCFCGESDPVVLEFDHVGTFKRLEVSRIINSGYLSLRYLQEEIEHCQVLCANCHRRKTAKDFGYYREMNECAT